MRDISGQLSWKDAEGSSHCLVPFRYCLETIKPAGLLFKIDCVWAKIRNRDLPNSKYKYPLRYSNRLFACRGSYSAIVPVSNDIFRIIVSIYPHARFGIGCPYFCYCKPQSVGKLAFAVTVSSLTSLHSVVPLLSRIRTSVNTRRQSGVWWCVRILAGEDSRGVNTGASWPRAQMR